MLKFVRWDDDEAIASDSLLMGITSQTKHNLTKPNPPQLDVFTGDIRMHVFNNQRMVGRIFMKFGMDVVPMDKTPNSYF
jgi:hypothetical protein